MSLNSIMILLIRAQIGSSGDGAKIFKFHYDSINSEKGETIDKLLHGFKFHYDSINSYIDHYRYEC